MNVIELLKDAAVPYNDQKERDNVYIECPFCNLRDNNLSINIYSGLWHCWSERCGEKGNFEKLTQRLGLSSTEFTPMPPIKRQVSLTEEEKNAIELSKESKTEIIEWAIARCIEPDFAFKIGIGYDKQARAMVFPFRNEKGIITGAKYRGRNGDQWIKGAEPDLYVIDYKDLTSEKIVVVEGEIDAITLKQFGIPAVATLGAGKDKGLPMLRGISQVYLGYDMDGAGEAGVEKAVAILGRYRTKRTHWTAKDPNDMLKAGGTRAELICCLRESRTLVTEIKSKSASMVMDSYLSAKKTQNNNRKLWGYPKLDKCTKGILAGWTIYLLAKGGAGKTTFLLNLMFNQMKEGSNVGIASYEEDPTLEISPKITAMIVGRNPGGGDFDPREIFLAQEELKKVQIFDGVRSTDGFCDWVRECYYVHGTRFFVADYLQMVVDDTSPKTLLDSSYKVGKDLCKELPGINIVWAVQPKLLQKQLDRKTNEKVIAKIDGSDARGGSVIEQSCDVFLVMTPIDNDTTQYEFTKVRGQLVVSKRDWLGQAVQLTYDHATLRLTENASMNYGGH